MTPLLSHRTRRFLLSLVGALLAFSSLQASAITATRSLTISLTVLSPTCTINDNQAATVNFGEIMSTRIVGDYKKIQIPLTLQCSRLSSNTLSLRIEGTGATFNKDLLETSIDALGIALWANNTRLALNSDFRFSTTTVPRLDVAPVLQVGVQPSGGEFSAIATLRVEYE